MRGSRPMTNRTIDLVYFEGCPNAERARQNLRAALDESGRSVEWSEWDLTSETTPEEYRQHGSPTVLVDGEDVTGGGAEAVAMACRADGAPSVAAIRDRLSPARTGSG